MTTAALPRGGHSRARSLSVLLVAGEFPPFKGGIARVGYYLARVLGQWGHRVTVVAPRMAGGERLELPPTCEVQRLPFTRLPRVRMLPALPFVLRESRTRKFEVCVGLRCTREGLVAWTNQKANGTPYVTFAYGTEFLRYRRGSSGDRMVQRILGDSRGTVAISHFTRHALVDRGVPPESITVMPPGVELTQFAKWAGSRAGARERLGLGDGPVLLTVSRLVPHKGHDTVIRALPELLESWPDLKYVIVGRGPNELRLRQLAVTCGVASAVRFEGYVSDDRMPIYYAACEVFAMPSREERGSVEGFGISFLEAAAYERPVIGGLGTGAEDAVAPEETGLLIDPRSPEALAQATASLLYNTERAREMGRKARARVAREFSWERVVRPVEQVLLRAAGRG